MKALLMLEPLSYYEELGFRESLTDRFELVRPPLLMASLRKAIARSDAVVSCLYHSPLAMRAAALARDMGKPVVYFSDGIEDWANMIGNPYLRSLGLKQHHPAYADVYFLCCRGGAEYLSAFGKEAFVYSPLRVFSGVEFKKTEKSLMPAESKFLVSTANTAYFDDAEFDRLVVLLKQVKKSLDDKGFSYKYRILDKRLTDAIGIADADNLGSGPFEQCLSAFDFLITTPSSIAIPAIKNNMPVALLDYRNTPLLAQTGWRLHLSCDMAETLESMTTFDPDRLAYQQTTLVGSVERAAISDVLEEVIKRNEAKTEEVLRAATTRIPGSRFGLSLEYLMRHVYLRVKRNGLVKQIARSIKSPK